MEFVKREPVDYGWSGDRKYHAWDADGKEYFLRVCSLENEGRMRKARELQQGAWDLGLPVSQPLGFERREDGIYMWERWLSGQMAKDALPTLPQEEQYRLGREAGEILRALHTIPAPAETEDWESRFNAKIDRKLQLYRECPPTVRKRRGVRPVFGGKPGASPGEAPVYAARRLPRGEHALWRRQAVPDRL